MTEETDEKEYGGELEKDKTGKYKGVFYAYEKENKVGTWPGKIKVPAFFQREWKNNMGDIRQQVYFIWDNMPFGGIYFKSFDYIRAKQIKFIPLSPKYTVEDYSKRWNLEHITINMGYLKRPEECYVKVFYNINYKATYCPYIKDECKGCLLYSRTLLAILETHL